MKYGDYLRGCSDKELAEILTGMGLGLVKALYPKLYESVDENDIDTLKKSYENALSKELEELMRKGAEI